VSADQTFVSVFNETKQTSLGTRITVADTGLSRLIGLLGKKSLVPETGVWLVPSNSIHTFGMLFRFDVVLIDRKHKVVGLRERIPPFWLTLPNFRAHSVLEVPVDTIARSQTRIGDQLLIR
jgi:uncharacterized membrane protein (UPF0127 family)